MIQITPHMRILVAVEPIDFRAGIDGLVNNCRKLLQADPFICGGSKYASQLIKGVIFSDGVYRRRHTFFEFHSFTSLLTPGRSRALIRRRRAMLELYYRYPRVLERLRSGALGAQMDRIAAHLSEVGYRPDSARIYLARIARFSRFAADLGCRDATAIDQDTIDRFLLARATPCAHIGAQTAIRHALRLVQDRWPSASQAAQDPHGELLAAYEAHLRQIRGLQPRTCEERLRAARRALEWCQEQMPELPLSQMTGKDVLALTAHLAGRSRNDRTRSATATYVRSFLHFLHWAGILNEDFARLVPRIPCWRMASVPDRLGWDEIKKVIDAVGATDPVGMRDRAVMLLLATTGVRNQELRLLELEDIHWRAGEVLIRRTKARRERVVPLLEEAGSALAEYVLHARPKVQAPQVFLSHTPPPRPLSCSKVVAAIVKRRLARCGLQPARAGAHLLRHSLATNLVSQRRPIKEIADLLGHQSIDTTAIYVKVALPQLASVALPFPGGES
jgi:integrase/recombinase XerD